MSNLSELERAIVVSNNCPKCGCVPRRARNIALFLGFKVVCAQCSTKLRKHPIWFFALYVLVVITTIASLGFVNLFGVNGFVIAGLLPLAIFLAGSYFIPLQAIG